MVCDSHSRETEIVSDRSQDVGEGKFVFLLLNLFSKQHRFHRVPIARTNSTGTESKIKAQRELTRGKGMTAPTMQSSSHSSHPDKETFGSCPHCWLETITLLQLWECSVQHWGHKNPDSWHMGIYSNLNLHFKGHKLEKKWISQNNSHVI